MISTTFKTIAALFAVGLPAALGAESFGVNLPAAIDTAHAFGAFVFALTLLTLVTDYRPRKTLAYCETEACRERRRSLFRLAA